MRRDVWPDAALYRGTILRAIKAQRDSQPRSALRVGGSWAGAKVLQNDQSLAPWLQWLDETVLRGCCDLSGILLWALVMEQGDRVRPHNHQKRSDRKLNQWAGVYYVAFPEGSGQLYASEEGSLTDDLAPREGVSLFFPATFTHGVTEHQSPEPRVSLAWSLL